MYAEINAHITDGDREYLITRQLFTNSGGEKAALSHIQTISGIADYSSESLRSLYEYLKNDTLFIYDSGDSTCLTLPTNDLTDSDVYNFPASAAWLLWENKSNSMSNGSDTLHIAGCIAQKVPVNNGFIWIWDNQPLAIELSSNVNQRSERVTRLAVDTAINNKIFIQPSGFRQMLPLEE